jgi:hypothetical protein
MGRVTAAHFELALDPKYAGGGPLVYSISTPEQQVGSDFSQHAVSTTVSGLLPNALYHVRLVATSSAGRTDGPEQTFMTKPGPAPLPPVLGKSAVIKPISGIVFVRLPSRGLVPLTEASRLLSGSVLDTRKGSVQLTAASATGHKTQFGVFGGAVFTFSQGTSGANRGLTTINLVEGAFPGAPTYASCKTQRASNPGSAEAASLSLRILQTLHASERGARFRTRGRYGAATVRGTVWNMSDRCDGTLTVVHRGTVVVTDFVRHRTVTLRAGQSYLAGPFARRR